MFDEREAAGEQLEDTVDAMKVPVAGKLASLCSWNESGFAGRESSGDWLAIERTRGLLFCLNEWDNSRIHNGRYLCLCQSNIENHEIIHRGD